MLHSTFFAFVNCEPSLSSYCIMRQPTILNDLPWIPSRFLLARRVSYFIYSSGAQQNLTGWWGKRRKEDLLLWLTNFASLEMTRRGATFPGATFWARSNHKPSAPPPPHYHANLQNNGSYRQNLNRICTGTGSGTNIMPKYIGPGTV